MAALHHANPSEVQISENAVQSLQADLSDEREQLNRLENISHGMDLRPLRQQNQ